MEQFCFLCHNGKEMPGLNWRRKNSISIRRKKILKIPFQYSKEEKHCPEAMRNSHRWGCLRTDSVGTVAPDCRAELHWITFEFTSSSLAPRHAQHTYSFTRAFGGDFSLRTLPSSSGKVQDTSKEIKTPKHKHLVTFQLSKSIQGSCIGLAGWTHDLREICDPLEQQLAEKESQEERKRKRCKRIVSQSPGWTLGKFTENCPATFISQASMTTFILNPRTLRTSFLKRD